MSEGEDVASLQCNYNYSNIKKESKCVFASYEHKPKYNPRVHISICVFLAKWTISETFPGSPFEQKQLSTSVSSKLVYNSCMHSSLDPFQNTHTIPFPLPYEISMIACKKCFQS